MPGVHGVDPHDQGLARLRQRGLVQQQAQLFARIGLAVGQHGVLQVETDGVGGAAERLGEQFRPGCRYEQLASHGVSWLERLWRSPAPRGCRSEEHTSELQSLMRISYAV